MNQSSAKVLSYLAGNEDINAASTSDLKNLVAENPYFPVAQFLLAEKLKAENDDEYLAQAQKTAVYFSNPYWLQFQLAGEKLPEQTYRYETKTPEFQEEPSEKIEIAQNAAVINNHPVTTAFSAIELVAASELAHHTLQELPQSVKIDQGGYPAPTVDPQHLDVETAEPQVLQADEEMAATERDTNEAAENYISELTPQPITNESSENNLSENLGASAASEVVELEEEMAGVSHDADQATEKFLDEVSANETGEEDLPDDEHDKMFKNIKAMLDATSEDADADTTDAVIPIDPYYTIDYFASQGIKLELDQNPQDQLGQNLKKFTQWLKHMKKLGPEDATETITRTESEADIQQIADSSNTVREVVTEAMALVLEKQGKKDKAIELYNKLSFLNPDKSSYFADKIKKLKGS